MHGRLRNCNPAGANGIVSQFTQADWDNWKMVTIRRPNGGEQPTVFFDIDKLRAGSELVVNTPRIGYMTTPAFFANWPTNPSNQHRVTINQTMIVALNKSFDDTINNNIPSIDTDTDPVDHVKPGTICFSLPPVAGSDAAAVPPDLQLLRQRTDRRRAEDPGRRLRLRRHADHEPQRRHQRSGVEPGDAHSPAGRLDAEALLLRQLGAVLKDDPEFQRVATVFKNSNFNFRTLVRELFSSPLVTLAARPRPSPRPKRPSPSSAKSTSAAPSHRAWRLPMPARSTPSPA